jgi:hypothetical protein
MEGGFGGGQPCGLAAAPQNTTDSHSETLCIESVLERRHYLALLLVLVAVWLAT